MLPVSFIYFDLAGREALGPAEMGFRSPSDGIHLILLPECIGPSQVILALEIGVELPPR